MKFKRYRLEIRCADSWTAAAVTSVLFGVGACLYRIPQLISDAYRHDSKKAEVSYILPFKVPGDFGSVSVNDECSMGGEGKNIIDINDGGNVSGRNTPDNGWEMCQPANIWSQGKGLDDYRMGNNNEIQRQIHERLMELYLRD